MSRYGEYGGAERWDRDRFERMRARSRGPIESDSFRFEESDRFGRGGNKREVQVDDRFERRAPRGGYEERDRFYEEDKFTPYRRAPAFYEEDRERVSGRELAPYRPKFEQEYDLPIRRPPRPGVLRRQSSLDIFDRRPLPRYREEDIDVRVALQTPPRRRREEFRDPYEEDYRDVRIRRERERSVYRRSDGRHGGSSDSFEEIEVPEPKKPKRGRTRMPKRLCHKRAIIELGYPFEEEEDFYVVRMALGKDQIDEVIKMSEGFFVESKTSYRLEERKMIEAPEPEKESVHEEPLPIEITETITTKIIENPTPAEISRLVEKKEEEQSEHGSQAPFSAAIAESIRSLSPSRSGKKGRSQSHAEFEEQEEEESEHVGGPLTLVVPERRIRKERDIKAEIRALEAEKRALKLEREAEEKRRKAVRQYEEKREKAKEIRETEYEIIEHKDRDVVRVEKDKRGTPKQTKASNKVIAAAMAALT